MCNVKVALGKSGHAFIEMHVKMKVNDNYINRKPKNSLRLTEKFESKKGDNID